MKIIFLDRDGVINEYPGHGLYVTKLKEFKFIKGAKEALKLLAKHDYKVYIISNQGGVSSGVIKKKDLDAITKKLTTDAVKAGGKIKKVLYCLHAKEDNCDCKKPKVGLFIQAVGNIGDDFKRIYFIGDDKRDVEASRKLGCKSVLVFSGKTTKKELHDWEFLPDRTALNLLEAVKKIVLPSKVEK